MTQLTYDSLTDRSVGVVSPDEQRILRETSVAVAGLGAGGGTAAMLLARSGVGAIRGSDPDVFDATNVNRQVFASAATLGQSKADVTRTALQEINPEIKADIQDLRLTTVEEGRQFLDGMDHAIIAVDNRAAILPFVQAATELDVPVTVMSAVGFRGFVTTLHGPQALPTLRWFLGIGEDDGPEEIAAATDREKRRFMAASGGFTDEFSADFPAGRTTMKVLAPVAFLVSSYATAETIKWRIGRGHRFVAPDVLSFDTLTGQPWDVVGVVGARKDQG
ncbi:hypothetical protein AQ490_12215 [Wenjunlia vitaminophila]|uniref:THIF-type NAD/FAD binding fold domain-containing protein n=1 Tax=Wenjunlia vitaminophila TaxID=76728 RepID=A0A0T6LKR4_WENVI|nr:ThiF family adenylyltransferase [Wenjunlia vitaminophila]KRV46629.1 hypothetical protein AQ490_12215 [Wenjunlia vitaminophila]